MKNLMYLIQAACFYLLTLLVALLPPSLCDRAGVLTGLAMFRLIPKRRAIAIDNIAQALPFMQRHPLWNHAESDPERIARETFKNIGRSLVEACRLYHGKGEDLFGRIEVRGAEHFRDASAQGKGVVFFTGHCGNWELGGLAFCRLLQTRMSVVARRQNNPYLNRMVEKMRGRYDNGIIYKQGALKGILSVLKKGGTIGLLADQAVSPAEGELIDMLGRKAWASKAPVIIAHKTGAPFLPSFIHREGDRFVVTINPPHRFSDDQDKDGVHKDVQDLSRYVEEYVIAHPTQWYWVHRRWKRAGEPSQ